VEGACRLASLVYLGDIPVVFMEYHHIIGYHFVERLKRAVLIETSDWENLQDLRLWALVLGGIKAREADRRVWRR
jgi:hypothetical protein